MSVEATGGLVSRPFVQGTWSAAARLEDWRQCPVSPGLYAIGIAHPVGAIIGPTVDNQGKLGGLPDHFEVVYIGRSLERSSGIRGRLGRHFRGGRSGNRCVGMHVRAGVEFWYCVLAGTEAAALEAMYPYFVPHLRPRFNIRGELTRHLKEQHGALADYVAWPGWPYAEDLIAPAGPTSLEGVNRLAWSRPNCELSRP